MGFRDLLDVAQTIFQSYLGATSLACVIFFLTASALVLISYYSDRAVRSKLVTAVATASLVVSTVTPLVLPADVYGAAHREGEVVRALYLVLFSALAVLAFVAVPFAYFYVKADSEADDDEEDDEYALPGGRCCAAARNTVLSALVLASFVGVGLALEPGEQHAFTNARKTDPAHWLHAFAHGNAAERAVMIVIAALTVLGTVNLVVYTGYGLAMLPLRVMRDRVMSRADSEMRAASERNAQQRLMRKRLLVKQYLGPTVQSNGHGSHGGPGSARKNGRGGGSGLKQSQTPDDSLNGSLLSHNSFMANDSFDEREDAAFGMQDKILHRHSDALPITVTGGGGGGGLFGFLGHRDRWASQCWTVMKPFRLVLGGTLLLLSALLACSLAGSLGDMAAHSHCGLRCGFAVEHARWPNPMDSLLVAASRVFPLDYAVMVAVVLYLFACTLFAVFQKGIRFLFFEVSTIRRARTRPQALLLACLVMMLSTLALVAVLMHLAPQHATFGSQVTTRSDGTTEPCRSRWHKHGAGNGSGSGKEGQGQGQPQGQPPCQMSELGSFYKRMNAVVPLFGLCVFVGQALFVAVWFVCTVWHLACEPAVKGDGDEEGEGGEDHQSLLDDSNVNVFQP